MAKIKKIPITIRADLLPIINELTDAELGKVMRAIINYVVNGIDRKFDDRILEMAYGFIKRPLDKDISVYEDICKKRAESGHKGGIESGITRGILADKKVRR